MLRVTETQDISYHLSIPERLGFGKLQTPVLHQVFIREYLTVSFSEALEMYCPSWDGISLQQAAKIIRRTPLPPLR